LPCFHRCGGGAALSDQPVSILQREANAIAQVTGRTPCTIKPLRGPADVQRQKVQTVARYTGVACTFLGAEGECTIYDVRPLTCRTHHSIADNADPCDITRYGGDRVPSIDLLPIKWAAAQDSMGEPFADIREFFPAAGAA
jgi:Fe-S-cluster containining protein